MSRIETSDTFSSQADEAPTRSARVRARLALWSSLLNRASSVHPTV